MKKIKTATEDKRDRTPRTKLTGKAVDDALLSRVQGGGGGEGTVKRPF